MFIDIRAAEQSFAGKSLIYSPGEQYSFGDRMAGITPHKHCVVCGNAIGEGNFCDELCESKFKSTQRRQQIMFGAFIVFMLLILVLPALLGFKG